MDVTQQQPLSSTSASPSATPTSASTTGTDLTFDRVFVSEYQAMVALAVAVSGSRVHAEDIAQDAMTKLDRNWARVSEYNKPGAWLRRVTINLALSEKRKRANEMRALLRLKPPTSTLPEAPVGDADIWEHVTKLPKMQRAVISLAFLEDRTTDEISEILEIEPATVRVHLHRARRRLHDALTTSSTASPSIRMAPTTTSLTEETR